MMTLQAGIVGENLARSQENGGAAQWPVFWLTREQDWGEANAVTAEFVSDFAGIFQRHFEVPTVRLQPADLFAHRVSEFFGTGAEADDHRFRIFSEKAKPPLFEALFHGESRVWPYH